MTGGDAPAGPAAGSARPAVILVEPQLGQNIGATARAMMNCGLTDLRLVAPRDGWPNEAAVAMASGADTILETARVFDTTAAAVGDLTYVLATTARPRDMAKTVLTPRRAAAELRARAAGGLATGVLFGPERSGLTNPDVVRADAVIQVPLNPVFSSLNLAQAVLLVGYEWYQAGDDTPDVTLAGDGVPAALEKREYFYGRLEAALTESGFLFPENLAPTIKRNLRNLFNRAALTEQEVSTLHGVVKALLKHRPASNGPGPGGA